MIKNNHSFTFLPIAATVEVCQRVEVWDYVTRCWENDPEDRMNVTCGSYPALVGHDYQCTWEEVV